MTTAHEDQFTPAEVTLLPCPFCGNEAELIPHAMPKTIRHYVQCDGCDCRGPTFSDQRFAIAAWNTRTASAPAGEVEPVACVECGGGGTMLEMDRMVSCFECRGSGEMPVAHPPAPADLVEALREAEQALESARVFILRETGCRNPYRDEVLQKARAALAKHGGA